MGAAPVKVAADAASERMAMRACIEEKYSKGKDMCEKEDAAAA